MASMWDEHQPYTAHLKHKEKYEENTQGPRTEGQQF